MQKNLEDKGFCCQTENADACSCQVYKDRTEAGIQDKKVECCSILNCGMLKEDMKEGVLKKMDEEEEEESVIFLSALDTRYVTETDASVVTAEAGFQNCEKQSDTLQNQRSDSKRKMFILQTVALCSAIIIICLYTAVELVRMIASDKLFLESITKILKEVITTHLSELLQKNNTSNLQK